jgi:hypothetical protein
VRAARIAVEVGPIGVRRIDLPGSLPSDGLAAGGQHGADTIGQRIGWIGAKKVLIAFQRIALDRGGIGVLRSEVSERP